MRKILGFEKYKWQVLSNTSLAAFMTALSISIVNIALPGISEYFGTTLHDVEWVVLIFLLLMSSLLLTFGRLGDMFGHKKVYLCGFAVFTIFSLLTSLAPNILSLIILRGMQAIGASMIVAVVQAIIADSFAPNERGKAIGINAVFVSIGLAAGPSIGGLLMEYYGWRSIFLVNVPVGILAFFWALRILPSKRGVKQKFDIGGALTIFASLMLFLLGMNLGGEWGWQTPRIVMIFMAAAVFMAIFIYLEARGAYPMIQLQLFKNRLFAAANAANMICFMTQYAVVFLMPFYLLDVLQLPSRQAGLIMAAMPLAMMFVAPVSGMMSDRIGSRLLSSVGLGVIAVGVLLLSSLDGGENLWQIALIMAIVGIGAGLFASPNTNAVMGSVAREQNGVASGMVAMMRSIGQALGVAVAGAVYTGRTLYYTEQFSSEGLPATNNILIMAQHDAFIVAVGLAVLGMLVSLVRGKTIVTHKKTAVHD